ncbi:MAG: class I SAM-dependent methyltransferase [Planctomycetota bacterium]
MATEFSQALARGEGVLTRTLESSTCKLCGGNAPFVFGLPSSKLAGGDIPDLPDDCPYYRCESCKFLFAHLLDEIDNTQVYDESYWDNQDPDWHGRVNQTLRLVMLSNLLLNRLPWELEICDFGCGMGTFVEAGRQHLGLKVTGFDIIQPKFGLDHFIDTLPEQRFDLVVACEVIEHLPDPLGMIEPAIRALKPGGVFAYQTAVYEPQACGRDWWYLGPANGHISLYSRGAFDVMFKKFGGTRRLSYDNYPGVQAWQIGGPPDTDIQRAKPRNNPLKQFARRFRKY